MSNQSTLLVTVDSLRYDHYDHMPETIDFLGESHPRAFATSTATAGSFQSIIGGYYPNGAGLNDQTSVVDRCQQDHTVGITTNHLLSERYGYDSGFDSFVAPSPGSDGIKGYVQRALPPGGILHTVAVTGWNAYQRLRTSVTTESPTREYRPAGAVIDDFLETVADVSGSWFGWLHLMEPHHPYNPSDGPVDRVTAQSVSRRVLAGNGDEADKDLARELYAEEIKKLDAELSRLWDHLDTDTRVVFCADHGECLGEDGLWGHPGELRTETLHVPLATANAPDVGDVASLVDVPSLLLGDHHGEGSFDRKVAFATYGEKKAAIDESHIKTANGTLTHGGEPATVSALDRAYARFSPSGFVKEDADRADLEALGYV